MRLRIITAHELSEALNAVGCPPGAALRDPVRCMRYAASAEPHAVRAALRALLAPGFELPEDEDELRLFGAAVIGRALVQVRGKAKEKFSGDVCAVPV